ncbi:3'5'-cyclic nucleotide phosphodiesterase family protein [Histomonas meleagridis]|uniref:3'5'-cyclic nucleotide phosphodiesterase family protein n=1 Tax=Histomonas meleagridis TaxID=135588 RepID=UPI0035594E9D|nr:3'5'-cyclic nucleotide phosphodiesterase family protein [Histomonas meleagridis]KAH0802939.1 3'5'-cyclic nucleotide phosphodiesterase family protein [Histomonas meleagridis]
MIKNIISPRAVAQVSVSDSQPLEVPYIDTNPPPQPIDQFMPYLSKKISIQRKEKIERIRSKNNNNTSYSANRDPQLFISSSRRAIHSSQSPRRTQQSKFDFETGVTNPLFTDNSLENHIRMEAAFDKIVSGSSTSPISKLVETTLQLYFLSERVLYFHDISSIKTLYCPSTMQSYPHGTGIVGYIQYTRNVENIPNLSQHIAYSTTTSDYNGLDPNSQILGFPLFDISSTVVAVVLVIRSPKSCSFNSNDEKFVEYFQNKCKIYSRWLFQPIVNDSYISTFLQSSRIKTFISTVTSKLCELFNCKFAEIWSMNNKTGKITKYLPDKNEPISLSIKASGIAGFSLRKMINLSLVKQGFHSAYNNEIDGNSEISLLSMPIKSYDSQIVYLIILRGKKTPNFFTNYDEKLLVKISPYIITTLKSSNLIEESHSLLKNSHLQQKRLAALLEVAESLSGQLKMDVLIPNIMNKACELVKADRCSLFMINEAGDKLITSFQGGLENSIEMPIESGIVGYTATTGEIINIEDAYQDSRFNKATDLETGYRTLSILSVPIFDERGKIIGVTEMINKMDEKAFSADDEKMIKVFNVFTGISIENARLYNTSIELSLRLKSFIEISNILTHPFKIKRISKEVLKNIRKVIGAMYAYLFIINNNLIENEPYVVDEDIDTKLGENLTKNKNKDDVDDVLGVKKAFIKRLLAGNLEEESEELKQEKRKRKLLHKVLKTKKCEIDNNEKEPEESLLVSPVFAPNEELVGCVVMKWKKNSQKFTYADAKIFEGYAVFLYMSIEMSKKMKEKDK